MAEVLVWLAALWDSSSLCLSGDSCSLGSAPGHLEVAHPEAEPDTWDYLFAGFEWT